MRVFGKSQKTLSSTPSTLSGSQMSRVVWPDVTSEILHILILVCHAASHMRGAVDSIQPRHMIDIFYVGRST